MLCLQKRVTLTTEERVKEIFNREAAEKEKDREAQREGGLGRARHYGLKLIPRPVTAGKRELLS